MRSATDPSNMKEELTRIAGRFLDEELKGGFVSVGALRGRQSRICLVSGLTNVVEEVAAGRGDGILGANADWECYLTFSIYEVVKAVNSLAAKHAQPTDGWQNLIGYFAIAVVEMAFV